MSLTHQNQESERERKIARILALLPDNAGMDIEALSPDTHIGSNGSGVTEYTYSNGGLNYVTTLTFTNLMVGTPTAGGNSAHGVLLYTFPAGVHVHTVTYFSLGLTIGTVTTDTPDVGIGSVIGAGAVNILSGTAAFENYITGQTWGVALTGAQQTAGPLGATAGILTGISLNAVGSTKSVYLNVADGWAAGITGNLTATGTVVLMWTKLT